MKILFQWLRLPTTSSTAPPNASFLTHERSKPNEVRDADRHNRSCKLGSHWSPYMVSYMSVDLWVDKVLSGKV